MNRVVCCLVLFALGGCSFDLDRTWDSGGSPDGGGKQDGKIAGDQTPDKKKPPADQKPDQPPPQKCGNGKLDSGEKCDGKLLGGATCESLGYASGTLACNKDCKALDTAGCVSAKCGNNKKDGKDECDGTDLGGQSCTSLGFDCGTLSCSKTCKLDSGGCGKCGDGKKNCAEVCDGTDLGGQSCTSLGFDGGALKCQAGCKGLDSSGCAKCGDGKLGTGEPCDGTNLGGKSCASVGWLGGTLKCASGCKLDESGCYTVCPKGYGGPDCKVCEVGYGGTGCGSCEAPYTVDKDGLCSYVPSHRAAHAYLEGGVLPYLEHRGPRDFRVAGTASEPIIEDLRTGLQWRRCPAGQKWSSGACTGTIGVYNWSDAMKQCGASYAGKTDWRLPEETEYESIVGYTRRKPSMDADYWPSMSTVPFAWSHASGTGTHAMMFLVDGGGAWLDVKTNTAGRALCVRGGTTASTRRWEVFDSTGALLHDRYTGLVWPRCPVGMTWSGSACSGSASKETWDKAGPGCTALKLGGMSWRLPSARELRTLYPACDKAAFPGGCEGAWSSTREEGTTNVFAHNRPRKPTDTYQVRCVSSVRAGWSGIDAGADHFCGTRDDGRIWCWGRNSHGQLGAGSHRRRAVRAVRVPKLAALSVGGYHTCALRSDGYVWCWGRNSNGQLGDGGKIDSAVPRKVKGLSGVKVLAAGGFHSCALLTSGEVLCWGANGSGQLGNGTKTDSSTPVEVKGLTGVTGLAPAKHLGRYSCALKSDGTVWCWGTNLQGQLGNNSSSPSTTPVQVSGLSGVKAVYAGGIDDNSNTSCAIKNDGTAWCWGSRPGDGAGVARKTPAQVKGLAGVQSMAVGCYHVCALDKNDEVHCWGENKGRLGNGKTADSHAPVAAIGNGSSIAACHTSTCAVRNDSSLWCWGGGTWGEHADGAYTGVYLVPTPAQTHGSITGCSDGTREGFTSSATHPGIAACAGGWSIPGIRKHKQLACLAASGNDSGIPSGGGCAAEDLCAAGWHLCSSSTEVWSRTKDCSGSAAGAGLFFATRQSGSGSKKCDQSGVNDLFGCGSRGDKPDGSCSPLDRTSGGKCLALGSPWSCGTDDLSEANDVTKSSAAGGGVLCCRD